MPKTQRNKFDKVRTERRDETEAEKKRNRINIKNTKNSDVLERKDSS
jgi:hypothetical protein